MRINSLRLSSRSHVFFFEKSEGIIGGDVSRIFHMDQASIISVHELSQLYDPLGFLLIEFPLGDVDDGSSLFSRPNLTLNSIDREIDK